MAVLQGTKALEAWCQIVTRNYPNVSINNMTTSWRSGLGFCALIHHFRPDLLDYDSLKEDSPYENNALAFAIAEQHLGINALLDPADMLLTIDRLSILTYLSQFYQAFGGATARSASSNAASGGGGGGGSLKSSPFLKAVRRDSGIQQPCQFCQKPVLFLLERLNINGLMAHRTCFKCARCGSQLSLANYYETEKGDFCCEICPDEEVSQAQLALTNKLKREKSEEKDASPEEALASAAVEEPPSTCDNIEKKEPLLIGAENESSEDNFSPEGNEEVPHKAEETIIEQEDSSMQQEQPQKEEESNLPEIQREDNDVNGSKESLMEDKPIRDEVMQLEDELNSEVEQSSISNKEEIPSLPEEEQALTIPNKEGTPSLPEEDGEQSSVPSKEDISLTLEETEEEEQSSIPIKENTPSPARLEETTEELSTSISQISLIEPKEEVKDKETKNNTEEPSSDCQSDIGKEEPTDKDNEDAEQYPEDLNPFDIDDKAQEEGMDSTKALKDLENQSMSTSLNPFGSDFEDEEGDQVRELLPLVPPPKPPRAIGTMATQPSLNPFGSDFEDSDAEGPSCRSVSPSPSCTSSMTIRSRKKRRAPPPPVVASEKFLKERDNINRRSQISNLNLSSGDISLIEQSSLSPLSPDKSDGGIWKKKKGPAPPRPIPPKRQVKKIPRKAVNTELIDIEVKQLEFERQGVQLEKTIRELCERGDSENAKENNGEDSLGPEAEDLIIQLFELVNEKNELFRRQTELMYMKREHRLEEEHADLEYQIRVLMNKDTLNEDQKKEEESLISRLMTVVSQRNEIVDCLEMDRLRELEEDESIELHMGEFAAVKPPESSSSDKKKKKKKNKEKKSKSFDVDKDIDTKEEFPPSSGLSPKPSPKKDKAKKLRKKLLSSVTSLTSAAKR